MRWKTVLPWADCGARFQDSCRAQRKGVSPGGRRREDQGSGGCLRHLSATDVDPTLPDASHRRFFHHMRGSGRMAKADWATATKRSAHRDDEDAPADGSGRRRLAATGDRNARRRLRPRQDGNGHGGVSVGSPNRWPSDWPAIPTRPWPGWRPIYVSRQIEMHLSLFDNGDALPFRPRVSPAALRREPRSGRRCPAVAERADTAAGVRRRAPRLCATNFTRCELHC